ncbi:hypothetical protein HELRODRAFT_170776 [Helobdella robusta]|uniref:Uncharacterized protein n=1 Tax=Helobdella robusta TaxID=6412 RepID=T1F3E9_HELRO|nr:hypothetical protein HELRODRAFT_170776 [Helobdella robusta]ESO06763.1 hypothetical protein HELRODRAFT_170776 [Helobdella robusta]
MSVIDQIKIPCELFQIIEELRCRKAKDKETESNMKLLVKEKIELEKSMDTLTMKLKHLEAEHLLKIDEIKVSNINQSVAMDEKLKKQKLIIETSDKAIEILRNENSKLQLANFTLERKINEQNEKILHNNSLLQSFTKQKLDTEILLKSFKEITTKVNSDLSKLALEVKESIKVNSLYSEVINNLKDELKQTNYSLELMEQKIINSSANDVRMKVVSNTLETSIDDFKIELSALQNCNKSLTSRLEDKELKYNDLLKTVSNFQSLLSSYSESNAEKSLKIKQLENALEKATEEIFQCKKELEEIISSNVIEKNIITKELDELKLKYKETLLLNENFKMLNSELQDVNSNLKCEMKILKETVEQIKASDHSKHSNCQNLIDQTMYDNLKNDDIYPEYDHKIGGIIAENICRDSGLIFKNRLLDKGDDSNACNNLITSTNLSGAGELGLVNDTSFVTDATTDATKTMVDSVTANAESILNVNGIYVYDNFVDNNVEDDISNEKLKEVCNVSNDNSVYDMPNSNFNQDINNEEIITKGPVETIAEDSSKHLVDSKIVCMYRKMINSYKKSK